MAKLHIATFLPSVSLPGGEEDAGAEHDVMAKIGYIVQPSSPPFPYQAGEDTFAEHDLMAKPHIATFLPFGQDRTLPIPTWQDSRA